MEKEIYISNIDELIDYIDSLNENVSILFDDIKQEILDEEEPEFYDLQEV